MGAQHVRESLEQFIDHLDNNPDAGRGPDTPATAIPESGIRMRVDGPNDWTVATDHAEEIGGGRTAPNPGWYWRAALASCDATVLTMRAAQVGIDLTTLEVTVESESDARGSLGIDDTVTVGPARVQLHFRLSASNAGPDRLRELVEWTEAHSPVGHAIGEPTSMEVEVTVE